MAVEHLPDGTVRISKKSCFSITLCALPHAITRLVPAAENSVPRPLSISGLADSNYDLVCYGVPPGDSCENTSATTIFANLGDGTSIAVMRAVQTELEMSLYVDGTISMSASRQIEIPHNSRKEIHIPLEYKLMASPKTGLCMSLDSKNSFFKPCSVTLHTTPERLKIVATVSGVFGWLIEARVVGSNRVLASYEPMRWSLLGRLDRAFQTCFGLRKSKRRVASAPSNIFKSPLTRSRNLSLDNVENGPCSNENMLSKKSIEKNSFFENDAKRLSVLDFSEKVNKMAPSQIHASLMSEMKNCDRYICRCTQGSSRLNEGRKSGKIRSVNDLCSCPEPVCMALKMFEHAVHVEDYCLGHTLVEREIELRSLLPSQTLIRKDVGRMVINELELEERWVLEDAATGPLRNKHNLRMIVIALLLYTRRWHIRRGALFSVAIVVTTFVIVFLALIILRFFVCFDSRGRRHWCTSK